LLFWKIRVLSFTFYITRPSTAEWFVKKINELALMLVQTWFINYIDESRITKTRKSGASITRYFSTRYLLCVYHNARTDCLRDPNSGWDVIFRNNFFTDFREGGYNRCLLASKIIKLFINLISELIFPTSCTMFQVRRIASRCLSRKCK